MNEHGVKHIIKFLQHNYRDTLNNSQYEQLRFLRTINGYGVQSLRKVFSIAIAVGAYPECPYCKKPIYTQEELTIDHTIPRAKGGADNVENLQPMHGKCNCEKGCSMPVQSNEQSTTFAKKPKRQKHRSFKRPVRPESISGRDIDDLKQKCQRIDELHGCRYYIIRTGRPR